MSGGGVHLGMGISDATGLVSKTASISVHVKGCVGDLRVPLSDEKRYSRKQPLMVVPDNAWKHECTDVSDSGGFSRDMVTPSGGNINNDGQFSGSGNIEQKKNFELMGRISVRSTTVTDPPTSVHNISPAERTPGNQKTVYSTRFRLPLTSTKDMTNNNSTKKFNSNTRPFLYLHPQTRTKSKAPDKGILDKVVRYCHFKQTHDRQSHKHYCTDVPRSKAKRSKLIKHHGTTLSTLEEEGKPTSILPTQESHDAKNTLNTCQDKSEDDDQLMAQLSAQVEHIHLSLESVSTPELSTIPVEPQPTHHITSSQPGVQHLREKDDPPSQSPIDEVNTLTSIPDVSTAYRPTNCEGDIRTDVILVDGAKNEANSGFRSQNFMHFTTTVSQPIRKLIQVAPSVAPRNTALQLTPYSQTTRCIPIRSQLRTRHPRRPYQFAPNISVITAGKKALFIRKQFIKKSFFLPESANLEDILADADDRRIVAICNRFHCEMVAFSKVPRKGSMKHEVIISGGCRDDIAKCARCLDARLNWCISPQLD